MKTRFLHQFHFLYCVNNNLSQSCAAMLLLILFHSWKYQELELRMAAIIFTRMPTYQHLYWLTVNNNINSAVLLQYNKIFTFFTLFWTSSLSYSEKRNSTIIGFIIFWAFWDTLFFYPFLPAQNRVKMVNNLGYIAYPVCSFKPYFECSGRQSANQHPEHRQHQYALLYSDSYLCGQLSAILFDFQ